MTLQVTCLRLHSPHLQQKHNGYLHDAPCDHFTATLRLVLTEGISILTRFSRNPCYLLQNIREPSMMYYISHWPNAQGYAQACVCQDFKVVMEELRSCTATLEWDETYDVEYPCSRIEHIYHHLFHKRKAAYCASTIAITRFSIAERDPIKFREHLRPLKSSVESTSGFEVVIGSKLQFSVSAGTSPRQLEITASRGSFLLISGWDAEKNYSEPAAEGIFWGVEDTRKHGFVLEEILACPIRLE